MRGKLIVANWKMAPATLAEAQGLLEFTDEFLSTIPGQQAFSLVVCPPFIFIEEVAKILTMSRLSQAVLLGAQDIFWTDQPAHTGEISGPMLAKLSVRYVIIGHSERRWQLGESDEIVNQKIKAALRNELTPIVCLGERIRDESFKSFLQNQVRDTFTGLDKQEISKCIIAYEPVWAISSNPSSRPDTPESALESIRIIQDGIIGNWKLEIGNLPKVLYGGSVSSSNIADFISRDEIQGVLIGGASVKKDEFIKILSIAASL
ncbi:MAG: triose-phosphate isomerase [Candidatus Yanofskybacteria bacterium]|nr:triose-phosphate isomerase [Candidatus Yanofskybacteria bacterium]